MRFSVYQLVPALALCIPATLAAQKHRELTEATYPSHVLIIRHAEKPPDTARSVDLAPAGIARAKALGNLFVRSATRPDPFPTPDFIFAARDTKVSHRPSETAAPLGTSLGLAVDTKFRERQVQALARELLGKRRYAGRTVVVVWHPGTIPDLAHALGAKAAPRSWKNSVFDRVWEITYDGGGDVSFRDRPQGLMPGDSRE